MVNRLILLTLAVMLLFVCSCGNPLEQPGGLLDNSFNAPDGFTLYNGSASGGDRAYAMALSKEGRVLVAGSTYSGGDEDLLLLRYTSEGRLDSSFGQGGAVIYGTAANGQDCAYGVALQADGKILVTGAASNGRDQDLLLLRFLPDGTLDPSFGKTGVAVYSGGEETQEIGRAVAVQADGKIVVAGEGGTAANLDALILRFTFDGKLDPSFASKGLAYYSSAEGGADQGLALALQADGKILLAGSTTRAGQADLLLLRFTPQGALDPFFAAGGAALYDGPSQGADCGNALTLQPDGKILAAGFTSGPRGQDILLLRYTGSGQLDSSFGQAGVVLFGSPEDVYDVAQGVAVQADGRILVVGARGGGPQQDGLKDALVLRFSSRGKSDLSFGRQGTMAFAGPEQGDDWAYALSLQADGRIVAAGSRSREGSDDALVMRLMP
ncbi:MAG: delta-60 repeat domain-containing protein [bacterium]